MSSTRPRKNRTVKGRTADVRPSPSKTSLPGQSDEEIQDAFEAIDTDLLDDAQPIEETNGDDELATESTTAPSTALSKTSLSLTRTDPLQVYMTEARRYPLLTREEEHKLAVDYHTHGNVEAARKLVTSNLRLVVKIAHEYRKAYKNVLDLVQEGNIGLMHAVRKFNPYQGVKLSSYAAWWIRAYILKFILNNWRLVKIGTTQAQRKLFYNLRKEIEQLQRQGIENPEPKLLAQRLDVPEEEVSSMQGRLSGHDVSLDAPLRNDDDRGVRLDLVTEESADPEQLAEDREFADLIRREVDAFAKTLSGREKEIFELRTVSTDPLTLQQIGDKFGITRERARQLERRIMDRLRDHLRTRLGDTVDVALGTQHNEPSAAH